MMGEQGGRKKVGGNNNLKCKDDEDEDQSFPVQRQNYVLCVLDYLSCMRMVPSTSSAGSFFSRFNASFDWMLLVFVNHVILGVAYPVASSNSV